MHCSLSVCLCLCLSLSFSFNKYFVTSTMYQALLSYHIIPLLGIRDRKMIKMVLFLNKLTSRKSLEFATTKMWSIDQQHWHHLGASWKLESQAPDFLNQNLHFNKVSRCFFCVLKYQHSWSSGHFERFFCFRYGLLWLQPKNWGMKENNWTGIRAVS